MPLKDMDWKSVSIHEVIWAWLCAERNTSANIRYILSQQPEHAALLDAPDTENADENWLRLKIIYIARWVFFVEIPPDTCWYEVRNLRDNDLTNLHAVNHGHWSSGDDQNELLKVAAREKLELESPPTEWGSIVLWGHTKDGPFTIIEGNHRLTAYAGVGATGLDIPVFVGLSPLKCIWHRLDKVGPLIQDMVPKIT
jgi:hypothetical protein